MVENRAFDPVALRNRETELVYERAKIADILKTHARMTGEIQAQITRLKAELASLDRWLDVGPNRLVEIERELKSVSKTRRAVERDPRVAAFLILRERTRAAAREDLRNLQGGV